jgi:hypothetical protein
MSGERESNAGKYIPFFEARGVNDPSALNNKYLIKTSEQIVQLIRKSGREIIGTFEIPIGCQLSFIGERESRIHPGWSYFEFTKVAEERRFGLTRSQVENIIYLEIRDDPITPIPPVYS